MLFLLKKMFNRGANARAWLILIWALFAWMLPQHASAADQVQWQLDKRVYARNEKIRASFENIPKPSDSHWVGIWSYPDSGTRYGAWDRATNGGSGSLTWDYLPATASGEVALSSLPPGRYAAFLLADGGYQWLSTPIIFWVTEDGTAQRESGLLESDQRAYDEGSTVALTYSGIAPAVKNWIGIWRYADGPGTGQDGPWNFAQTNASNPWKYVTAASGNWSVPDLQAGTYAAFLLADDGYQWLAPPAVFEVKAKNSTPPTTLIGPPTFDGKSTELKVMQFNIWLAGTGVGGGGPDMIADVIRDSGADVITLSESTGGFAQSTVSNLAKRGYRFYADDSSLDVNVVSRYPILETKTFNRFAKAVIDVNGTPVAVYSGHLEYRWYVCYLPRGYGGGTPSGNPTSQYGWNKIPTGPITDVPLILDLNEKSGRPESIRQFVADAKRELEKGRVVVMAGDFNEPSHLDWNEATKNLYDHNGAIIPWQSTTLLEQAGYLDAYRTKFPSPVTHPGFTWPSDNPKVAVSRLTWAPESDERDRIDYVFYQPDDRLSLQDATVVGPRKSILRSQRVEETSQDPFLEPKTGWPTDHKAVMATFVIKPLALTQTPLPAGQQNQPYSGSLSVVGGAQPYVYVIADGSLPPGVALSQDGTLSGTPTADGRFAFTVQVQDANGSVAMREYFIEVAAQPESEKTRSALQVTSSPNPSRAGDEVTFDVAVSAQMMEARRMRQQLAKAADAVGAVPSGTIDFTENGEVIGSATLTDGKASWTAPPLTAGTHAITVSYLGDAQFRAASMTFIQKVMAAGAGEPVSVPTLSGALLWLLGFVLIALGARRLKY